MSQPQIRGFRPFNPNAYGNPCVKPKSTTVVANNSPTAQLTNDLSIAGRALNEDEGSRMKENAPTYASSNAHRTVDLLDKLATEPNTASQQAEHTSHVTDAATDKSEMFGTHGDEEPVVRKPTRRVDILRFINNAASDTPATAAASTLPGLEHRSKDSRGEEDSKNKFSSKLGIEEALRKAQMDLMRRIASRNRGRDRHSTTSLKDLALARTPSQAIAASPSTIEPSQSLGARIMSQAVAITSYANVGPQEYIAPAASATATSYGGKQNVGNDRHDPVHKHDMTDTSNNHAGSSSSMKTAEAGWGSHDGLESKVADRDIMISEHNPQSSSPANDLADWEGKMLPPPDWSERSHFVSTERVAIDALHRWTATVSQKTAEAADRVFSPIAHESLEDIDQSPDGISMVSKTMVVNKDTAKHYGYSKDDAEDITKYANPPVANDFEDWGKLDMTVPGNAIYKQETAEQLVTNWNKHKSQQYKSMLAQIEAREADAQAIFDCKPAVNPNSPILNIYLRPACRSDIAQMTEIYNWYIENSARTAEIQPIVQEDMQERLGDVRSCKLPFLVAVERNTHSAVPFDFEAEAEAFKHDPHPIKNIDPRNKSMNKKEKIVGWACAQDFTASDFVERISVELEIYVDPKHRQMGIGRCLLDQLLDATDRGYMKKGGYAFGCPLEFMHLYNTGGGRDLHKLIIILRKWQHPKASVPSIAPQKYSRANPNKKQDDLENDYDMWLKQWLEKQGFMVEGYLKGVGAKQGRYIDEVYLSRETRWRPAEGKVPGPLYAFQRDQN